MDSRRPRAVADHGRMAQRRRPVPDTEHRGQRRIPPERLNLLVLLFLERPKAPKNIGHLPDDEPQIAQLQGDVFESQERRRIRLVPPEDGGVQLEGGKRDAALHAPLDLEKLEMQIDSVTQFGLPLLERAKFCCLPGFRAPRGSRTTCHPAIIQTHTSQVIWSKR